MKSADNLFDKHRGSCFFVVVIFISIYETKCLNCTEALCQL